ncbi:hypothetical protein [Clostridium brassicae]|uniref:Uncharacterized protein n=1 Tax=Clostridium brassicae TaxID=2999072 RepID=A0ABT4D406_9CLOT|nr:hypothetical protein [Clostridium brassicae]MCY6957013.1 hypothetical protein [Clostridium brassicae]
MGLEDIFLLIALVFLIIMMFFIFKKPKLVDKIEAIFVCLLGGLTYAFLCGSYQLEYSPLLVIFAMPFIMFFLGVIFFIIREPSFMKKWQAISICLFGFVAYGMLVGACYNLQESQKQNGNISIIYDI